MSARLAPPCRPLPASCRPLLLSCVAVMAWMALLVPSSSEAQSFPLPMVVQGRGHCVVGSTPPANASWLSAILPAGSYRMSYASGAWIFSSGPPPRFATAVRLSIPGQVPPLVQVVGLSSPFPSAAAAQQAAQQAVQQNSPDAAFTFTLKSPQSIYVGMLDSDCHDNSGAVNFQIEKLDGASPGTVTTPVSIPPPGGRAGSGGTLPPSLEKGPFTWEVNAGGKPETTFMGGALLSAVIKGTGTARGISGTTVVATGEITITQSFEPMSEAEILRKVPYRPSFLSITLKVQDAVVAQAVGGLAVRITAQVTGASDPQFCPVGQGGIEVVIHDRSDTAGGDQADVFASSETTGCWRMPRLWRVPNPIMVFISGPG